MDIERKKQIKAWKKNNPGQTDLQKINSSKLTVRKKIQELLNKGAIELSKPSSNDFENINAKGKLISYITTKDKYRSGGFITSWNDDYFTVLGGGGYGPRISFCVQFKDVKKAFIRKVDRNGPLKPKKATNKKSDWPVVVGGVTVYYARSKSDKARFKKTNKYNRMLKYAKEHDM
jgi:hypothetical protein